MKINLGCHLDGIWKHLRDTPLGVVIGDELGQDDLFSESEACLSWGLDTKSPRKKAGMHVCFTSLWRNVLAAVMAGTSLTSSDFQHGLKVNVSSGIF